MEDLLGLVGILILLFEIYRIMRRIWIRRILAKRKSGKRARKPQVKRPKVKITPPFA